MKKKCILLYCLLISAVSISFGQKSDSLTLYPKKHGVFFNFLNILDPSGSSLQFGYNYQSTPWLDLQMELGFVSDNLMGIESPFREYAGFRVRPQVKFLKTKTQNRSYRGYISVLLSYQRLNFKQNENFRVDETFNQNITYRGVDQTYAWYIVGGADIRSIKRITASFSIGLGQVWIKTLAEAGDIPENAVLSSDCIIFCGRSEALDRLVNRPGILFDFKIGYQF